MFLKLAHSHKALFSAHQCLATPKERRGGEQRNKGARTRAEMETHMLTRCPFDTAERLGLLNWRNR